MKRAAISFTFDDGSQDHMDVALPIFEEFGFKATFFVIAGLTRERKADPPAGGPAAARGRDWWAEVSWEEWREVARLGHEIGNHSMTHPEGGLVTVRDPGKLRSEIADSAELIAEKIGRRPSSFAYPYNKANAKVRAAVLKHHELVREKQIGYGGSNFSLAKANALVDRAIRKGQWLVPMIHGVGNGYNALAPELLREHLAYIKQREADLWIDMFGNVGRHIAKSSGAARPVSSQP